jgi:hypothetical protein
MDPGKQRKGVCAVGRGEKKSVTVCVCACVYDLRGQEPTFSADAGLSRLLGHHQTTPRVHLYADRASGIEPLQLQDSGEAPTTSRFTDIAAFGVLR